MQALSYLFWREEVFTNWIQTGQKLGNGTETEVLKLKRDWNGGFDEETEPETEPL